MFTYMQNTWDMISLNEPNNSIQYESDTCTPKLNLYLTPTCTIQY